MMRKSPMPARTVPLPRGGPLARVAGALRPHRARHVASGQPAVREDLTPGQRGLLWMRADGHCEAGFTAECLRRMRPSDGWHAGHRINRARGGHNRCLACRYLACPPCNYWQEDHPAAAAETGHYVRTGLDPHRTPVCLPWGTVVLLDEDGSYRAAGGDVA